MSIPITQMLIIKDKESHFLDCDNTFLSWSHRKNKDNVLGLTDYDFVWSVYADIYHRHDLDALNGKIYSAIHPTVDVTNRHFLVLVTKQPFCDQNNKVIGVSSHIVEVINPRCMALIYWLKKTDIHNPLKNYSIGKVDKDISLLSVREHECLFYILRGKTAKQIGKILGLSYRTIEGHLEKIKMKFNCSTKSDLISVAIEKGYANNIPETLFSTL